ALETGRLSAGTRERMNVLLLSMPDSFEHMSSLAVHMPIGALASLAGNVDRHHRVAVEDLILAQHHVKDTVVRLLDELEPDVVGLSIMTSQRATALKLARLIGSVRPRARIVAGGYDPSLAPHAYEASGDVDFLVRGEGEETFRAFLRAIDAGAGYDGVSGLAYRTPDGFVFNASRPVARLASSAPRLPDRSARVLGGY